MDTLGRDDSLIYIFVWILINVFLNGLTYNFAKEYLLL
jgi:hypothetical protein